MANVQHSALTGTDLHEPKGVAAASANRVYVSDGAGSGSWAKVPLQTLTGLTTNGTVGDILSVDGAGNLLYTRTAHGSCYFTNLAAPNTITYPSVYTKVAPTTVAGGDPSDMTEGTNARITYSGTGDRHCRLLASISLDQAAGSGRDVQLAFYRNGTLLTGSEIVATASSGTKNNMGMVYDVVLAPSDYVEVYVKNAGASGDVRIYSFYLSLFSFHKES
jgi:hypothetical protein